MPRSFSWKITTICTLLVSAMVGMAVWQWDRHLWKIELIQKLTHNLEAPPQALLTLPPINSGTAWSDYFFRRVSVSGTFDFSREVIIKNRRLGSIAGFHLLTPLKIEGSEHYILVNRGFIPLGAEDATSRAQFHGSSHVTFNGLVKESVTPRLFSPKDGETGLDKPWIDSWLRVDLANMQNQLPYKILPVYLELIGKEGSDELVREIVRGSEAGRGELLMYSNDRKIDTQGLAIAHSRYPIPAHDTTPPPDIHLGYVWEWSFLALLTASIGTILQLPRPRHTL